MDRQIHAGDAEADPAASADRRLHQRHLIGRPAKDRLLRAVIHRQVHRRGDVVVQSVQHRPRAGRQRQPARGSASVVRIGLGRERRGRDRLQHRGDLRQVRDDAGGDQGRVLTEAVAYNRIALHAEPVEQSVNGEVDDEDGVESRGQRRSILGHRRRFGEQEGVREDRARWPAPSAPNQLRTWPD